MKKTLIPIIAAMTLSACSVSSNHYVTKQNPMGLEKPDLIQAEPIKTVDITPNYCYQLKDKGWEPWTLGKTEWWKRHAIGITESYLLQDGYYFGPYLILQKDSRLAKCNTDTSQEVNIYSLADIEDTYNHNKQADKNWKKAFDAALAKSESKLNF